MPRPFRYTIIVALAAFGTALAAVGGWRYARASAPVNGPIIVISVDTLRADHLPAYGYKKVKTPAIDALAADGVVFERAYAHVPQTLPAHVALLSGRLPFDTGVRDDGGTVVKADERMLPQLLRERGFTTGGIVSSALLRRETGIDRGFDFFDAEMPQGAPDTPDAGIVLTERDGAVSEAIAERWLDQQSSSRVFLFLQINEPHAPYTPPARFSAFAPYDGEIAYSDEIVGRLLKHLKTHQLYDRSTIVLLSDHGEGLGDHGEQEHGLFVYDEAIHVPFILKEAAGVGAGRHVTDLVQHVDLVPTILDLVKAPMPGNLRGRSLRALLEGDGHLDEQPVYAESRYGLEHFGWSDLQTTIRGHFQYIKAPRQEIYDVAKDPREGASLGNAGLRAHQDLRDTMMQLAPPSDEAEDAGADPKDKVKVLELYRSAFALARDRKWPAAIARLQEIAGTDDGSAEIWRQIASFARRIDRLDVAVDADNHLLERDPDDVAAALDAAGALFRLHKLNEAHEQAAHALEVLDQPAGKDRAASKTRAHVLLAQIALDRVDSDEARQEAGRAHEADPALPMLAYVDGRLLYDQGQYEEALPLFEQASLDVKRAHAAPILALHYYAADTLAHLDRAEEAEAEYLEALRDFPRDVRARGGLASLYQTMGRGEEAGHAIEALLQVAPTPDNYALAAKLWKSLGNAQQADIVRAEARRAFPAEPAKRRTR